MFYDSYQREMDNNNNTTTISNLSKKQKYFAILREK
jgi:hypothetical protein